jgi:hypothetical protein
MQQFREPLLQLQRLIADLTPKLKSTGRVLGRLSWPLWGKEDAEKDLGAIERFKSLLNTCLAMDIWFVPHNHFASDHAHLFIPGNLLKSSDKITVVSFLIVLAWLCSPHCAE